MRSKGQHTTKTRDALGVYIDPHMIALSVVRDVTDDPTPGKNVRLLTQINRTAESGVDRLAQDVMTLCADELGDTTFASGCWIAIRHAQCLTVPLGAFSHPKALLHLDAAQQVSASVATQVSQHVNQDTSLTKVESLSQSNWLDEARPKEPPIFDYILRKRQNDACAVEAWLWWVSGESEIEFQKAMGRTGAPVEGLIPDGIALYQGLLHYWQENGVSPDCLQGEWVLIDGSTQTSAWFFCDCWFQVRKQYDGDEIVRDPQINRRHTVVMWRCVGDSEYFSFESKAVLDHLLRPHDLEGPVPCAGKTVSSLIALGLALQGVEPRVSEWYRAGDRPSINLLPWRGQRLQQLRSRLFVHIGIVTSLLTLAALLGAGLLNEALTRDLEHLSALAEQLEQREQGERQAAQQRESWRQDERTRDYLVHLAGTGERQLDLLRRVLEQIPECVFLTKVVLRSNGISVSGIASDPAQLRALPATLFAALAEDGKNILQAWPLLLSDPSRHGQSGHYDEHKRFILHVSFDKTPNARPRTNAQDVSKKSIDERSVNNSSINNSSVSKENVNQDRSNKEHSKKKSPNSETLVNER